MQENETKEYQPALSKAMGWWEDLFRKVPKSVLAIWSLLLLAVVIVLLLGRGLAELMVAIVVGAFGVFGIMWQTNKGFNNLIASQEIRAKIERDAREHQHSLDHKAEARRRDVAAKQLAAALRGELIGANQWAMSIASVLKIQKVLLEAMKAEKASKAKQPSVNSKFETLIYDANVGRIDYLNASLVADLVKVFSRVREQTSVPEDQIDIDFALASAESLAEAYNELAGEALHVALRLRAFEFAEEDPGTLLDRSAAKQKTKKSSARPNNKSSD